MQAAAESFPPAILQKRTSLLLAKVTGSLEVGERFFLVSLVVKGSGPLQIGLAVVGLQGQKPVPVADNRNVEVMNWSGVWSVALPVPRVVFAGPIYQRTRRLGLEDHDGIAAELRRRFSSRSLAHIRFGEACQASGRKKSISAIIRYGLRSIQSNFR